MFPYVAAFFRPFRGERNRVSEVHPQAAAVTGV